MTLELDLNHPPITDSNSLELWRFHALFDQPMKSNTDGGQRQKSPVEQRALQEKSATLLRDVQDYFHADRTNTYVALSTPFAAAGARALLGTTAGWCVAGAMFGWNLYNHFKLNHELTKINSDLTPDIRQNYKALSQAAEVSINSRSVLGDVTYGGLATALAMTVPRSGLQIGAATLGVGLAGYQKYWSAEIDNVSRAEIEVAHNAERLGQARTSAPEAPRNDQRVEMPSTVKPLPVPEVGSGLSLQHTTQRFTFNQPSISDFLKNIKK